MDALVTLEREAKKQLDCNLYLYGSHAYGTAIEGSDVNILFDVCKSAGWRFDRSLNLTLKILDGVFDDIDPMPMEMRRAARDRAKQFFILNSSEWTKVVANDSNSMITPMLWASHITTGLKFRFTFESSVPVRTAAFIQRFFEVSPECE